MKAAEADGFGFARRVMEIAEVRPRLEEFVAFPGPAFLEVMVDQSAHVYPMVAPGMGYKDMITEKVDPEPGAEAAEQRGAERILLGRAPRELADRRLVARERRATSRVAPTCSARSLRVTKARGRASDGPARSPARSIALARR